MTKAAWNERVKLAAGLFQGAATSAFGVGILAPIAALLYNPSAIASNFSFGTSIGISLLGVAICHAAAQVILGRVRD